MSTSKRPTKGILKKPLSSPSQGSSTTLAVSSSRQEERNRETALYHANLIQYRKDIELKILLNTETLIDYPTSTPPPLASDPSPSDAHTLKELLRPFQPSDFDSLLQERTINDKCAYALCANPAKKDGAGGAFRLLGTSGKARDFKIVKREDWERWCSEDCARRAMYIRVQLSETPAWERDGGETAEIELMGERERMTEEQKRDERLAEDLKALDISAGSMNADLAMERGEIGQAAINRGGLVNVDLVEKDVTAPAVAPSLENNDDDLEGQLRSMHLSLEGHIPKFGSQR
jgi:hypothetical protein